MAQDFGISLWLRVRESPVVYPLSAHLGQEKVMKNLIIAVLFAMSFSSCDKAGAAAPESKQILTVGDACNDLGYGSKMEKCANCFMGDAPILEDCTKICNERGDKDHEYCSTFCDRKFRRVMAACMIE